MRAVLRDLEDNHLMVRARSLVVRGLLEKIDRDADDPFRATGTGSQELPGDEEGAPASDSALLELSLIHI